MVGGTRHYPQKGGLQRLLVFASLAALAGAGCGNSPDPDAGPGGCDVPDLPGVCPGRGFYATAVNVALSAPENGDVIYYTLDGSDPGPDADAAIIFDGSPIVIDPAPAQSPVAVLRVVAYHDDNSRTAIVTHSYVFPERVLDQPALPAGVPDVWGFQTNTRDGDYEMDASVFAGADERAEAVTALTSIPTISLVTEPGNLWTPVSGLYMRPDAVGDDFERPISVEVLVPDADADGGFTQYHVDGGLQVQGNSSTFNWKSAKLSLRLAFRSEYGSRSFRAPLFGAGVTDFENLILDAHLNFTYLHPDEDQRTRSQYVRDQYTARLQRELGSLSPRGRPVHLYLNGLYWGLYDLHERPDANFTSSHLGGAAGDWDVLRHDSTNLVSGNLDAWNQMFALARAGLADAGNYASIASFLDIDDFIDYMLVNFYAGNSDWDHHNWYAARNRADPTGFRFFSWDAEKVLVDVNQDSTVIFNAGGPTELWSELLASADFRARAASRAAELYASGGPLHVNPASPDWDPAAVENNRPAALYVELTDELRPHILLETARWGDNQVATPYTRADWDTERGSLLGSYFPARSAIAEGQLPLP